MEKSELLEVALSAAADAAEVIRRHYRSSMDVRQKADRSPVTDADIESEELIRRVIGERYPDHGFFGEETGRSDRDSDYLWLVDPIDGTKSFIRHYPFFSTQIALMHRSELILGVSSAPAFDELAWAERGGGAWLDGKRVRVSEIDALENASVSAGNLRTLARSERWSVYGDIVASVDRIRGYGDFYHYHLLAAGKIDAVIESDVNILDIAALAVIIGEAGGHFTDLDGEPPGLETRSVVAANPGLHKILLDRLAGG